MNYSEFSINAHFLFIERIVSNLECNAYLTDKLVIKNFLVPSQNFGLMG